MIEYYVNKNLDDRNRKGLNEITDIGVGVEGIENKGI